MNNRDGDGWMWGDNVTEAQRRADLSNRVSETVGHQMAGALLGAAVVWAINRTTPLRPPWWLGIGVGAAIGASAEWAKEN